MARPGRETPGERGSQRPSPSHLSSRGAQPTRYAERLDRDPSRGRPLALRASSLCPCGSLSSHVPGRVATGVVLPPRNGKDGPRYRLPRLGSALSLPRSEPTNGGPGARRALGPTLVVKMREAGKAPAAGASLRPDRPPPTEDLDASDNDSGAALPGLRDASARFSGPGSSGIQETSSPPRRSP